MSDEVLVLYLLLYLSGAGCWLFAYGPAHATAIAIISFLILIQTGFYLSGMGYVVFPEKKAVKRV